MMNTLVAVNFKRMKSTMAMIFQFPWMRTISFLMLIETGLLQITCGGRARVIDVGCQEWCRAVNLWTWKTNHRDWLGVFVAATKQVRWYTYCVVFQNSIEHCSYRGAYLSGYHD